MPGLIIWKNQEINKMRRDMDRLFARVWDEFSVPLFPQPAREVPFIDVSETRENLIIKAEVPGINPEDLELSLADDILTIKGEMKQEMVSEGEDYHRTERRYGSFSRTLKLPCRVREEDVEATYKKGILNIVLPKCKPEKARLVKIEVK
ncbi:MAG: Hsp20/alpha crystallin family protein [Desulfatiglandales bacterium]